MKPNYVAEKSAISTLSFILIISCVLIIPIFVVVYRCLQAKNFRIEFYDDKIITYSGIIAKTKKQSVFMGVAATTVHQTVTGRIFNYGDVIVDCVGKWDIDTVGIKNPSGLDEYLQTKIMKSNSGTPIIHV